MRYNFDPHREKPGLFSGLWAFRRIIDRAQFEPGFYRSDACLVNWPMIDFMAGDPHTCTEAERTARIGDARQLSLSMVHWLQTEAPRPDGGTGWPGPASARSPSRFRSAGKRCARLSPTG